MTAKEVLQNIEKQREEAGIAFLGNIYLEVPEYREVINALEKQIPKKATDKEYVPNGKLVYGRCPVCNTFTDNYKAYCNKCGQAIGWSKEE